MRTPLDRLRHALSFEILALALVIPGGAVLFDQPMMHFGIVGLGSAGIATGWNMIYNWVFDRIYLRRTGSTRKTAAARVMHAVLFEAGLVAALMPFVAWVLGVTLWQALIMDLSLALFYLVYAFAFNWAYDRLFPLPDWQADRGVPQERPIG